MEYNSVDKALTEIKEKYKLNDDECKRLRNGVSVSIMKKGILDKDFELFKPILKANKNLTSLDFFGSFLGVNAMKILSESEKQLKELKLESNRVHGDAMVYLTKLENLEILDLSKNGLTYKDVKHLLKLEKLKELNLYYNKIGDFGILYLSQHPSIEILDVRRNRITNEGVETISNNTKLKTLIIGRNAITEKGLNHLLQSKSLEYIELLKSNIDPNFIIPKKTPFAQARGLSTVDDNKYVIEQSKYLALQNIQKRISSSFGMNDDHRIVLSIDGGGIRGLIPAMVLEEIQKRLILKLKREARISVDPNTFAIGSLFDLIAGTSTGGLIALGLTAPCEEDISKPRKSIEDISKLYTEKGPSVFKKKWYSFLKVPSLITTPYNPRSLEDELLNLLGDTKLSQSITPLLIPTYNLKIDRPFLFRSSKAKNDIKYDFYMRDVGRSTSAAPTYFEAAKIKSISNDEYTFIDGGVFSNNPSYYALKEAEKLYDDDPDYLVISLGTGTKSLNKPESLSNAGMARWGLNITGHLMANNENNLKDSVRDKCKKNPAIQYIRIQVEENMDDDVEFGELDDVKPKNIESLIIIAHSLIETHDCTLNEIVNCLYNVYIRKKNKKKEE